jgi:CubicO group peptidase (beta-lactamase class C family)
MRRWLCVILAPLAGCGRGPPARAPCDALAARVDEEVTRALREGPIPGASVVVEVGGAPVVARGYGLADVEHGVAATPDTVYGLASVSKMLTAAIVLQLVDEGRLRLDQPIAELVPEVAPGERRPTVAHLLAHTSGLREPASPERPPSRPLSRDDQIARAKDAVFDADPGERYLYANFGYVLLALAVERVEQKPFASVLRERIADRFGLATVQPLDFARVIPNRARMYAARRGALENAEPLSPSPLPAAGGLGASAIDLARFQRALDEGRVVSAAMLARMRARAPLAGGGASDYGFGTALFARSGHEGHGHLGSNGYRAGLLRFPDAKLTVVVLANGDAEAGRDLAIRVAELALTDPTCGR